VDVARERQRVLGGHAQDDLLRIVELTKVSVTFTFTFGGCFYPNRLTESTFVERDSNISLWYIKIRIEQVSSIHSGEANRTSFIIARLPA